MAETRSRQCVAGPSQDARKRYQSGSSSSSSEYNDSSSSWCSSDDEQKRPRQSRNKKKLNETGSGTESQGEGLSRGARKRNRSRTSSSSDCSDSGASSGSSSDNKRKGTKRSSKRDDEETTKTSIWQMTVGERKNAATFLQFTTVKPFIYMASSFKCFYCHKFYPDVKAIMMHTSTHKQTKIKNHGLEDREHILNTYISKGKRTLQVDISNLICKICSEVQPDLNSAKGHLKDAHGKKFYGVSNGMTEYNLEAVNDKLKCQVCGQEFHSFSLLSSHMNYHVGKVSCEVCGVGFQNQLLLRKHLDTHDIQTYNCKLCDREFFKKSQLIYHTKRHHKGIKAKPMKCELCPELFQEHYTKVLHLKEAHGISKSFPCDLCNSSFNMRRSLTEHTTKCHTEKYKCKICSKCFGTKYQLKLHLLAHTGQHKRHKCEVCNKAYVHIKGLNRHMSSHNTENS